MQIFEYLCAADPKGSTLEPEELSHAMVPDVRSFLMCEDFNLRDCDKAAIGDFHQPVGEVPILHLCNYRMTDGQPCSRKHTHRAHGHAMKQLRAVRLLGGEVMVRALEDSPGIILEGYQESQFYHVDRKENLVPDTGPVVTWRAEKAAANLIQHGRSAKGEPVTRYSPNHGVDWGPYYHDRSGGENDLDLSLDEDDTAFRPLSTSSASKKNYLASQQVCCQSSRCSESHFLQTFSPSRTRQLTSLSAGASRWTTTAPAGSTHTASPRRRRRPGRRRRRRGSRRSGTGSGRREGGPPSPPWGPLTSTLSS